MARELKDLLEQTAEAHGAHVIDLVIRGERNSKVIELFVDTEDVLTSELCAQISRDALAKIEEEDAIIGSFRLVVSSPGIQRPLRFHWQYAKHIGRTLEIQHRVGEQDLMMTGTLLMVSEEGIVLQQRSDEMSIRFSDIIDGKVKSPW